MSDIKIPEGWEKLPTGTIPKDTDRYFEFFSKKFQSAQGIKWPVGPKATYIRRKPETTTLVTDEQED